MWITILGYAASATVLATFCMSTMMPLRMLAIASNLLFSSYGALAHIYPVMILHLILLPINTIRLFQIRRLIQGVAKAQTTELTIESLLPYMTRRNFTAGEILIHRDARADRMFYLLNGDVQVELEELKKTLGPGTLLGEIGVFAKDHKRTATVRCVTDCEVYELTEAKAKEIYFQNPAFGYAILRIIITRLLEDLRLSEARIPTEFAADSTAPGFGPRHGTNVRYWE
jgi:CRP/FNR family cyclic AMP-dependent transcriptional regulator